LSSTKPSREKNDFFDLHGFREGPWHYGCKQPRIRKPAHQRSHEGELGTQLPREDVTTKCWTPTIFRTLCTTFGAPRSPAPRRFHYAVSTWSPYLRRDNVSLTSLEERCPEKGHETDQPSLRALTTTPAAEKLNLTALEERRPRGDLIQYYKEYRSEIFIKES